MDIRKIRHVVALAAERNFTRAASKLSLTQSALSHSIARLEDEIGLLLFDRSRSGKVQITTAGKEFIERAQEILIAEGGLNHELFLLGKGKIGRVAFGVGPIAANFCLEPVMARLISDSPDLRVHVELGSSTRLLDLLLEEKIEFFLADKHIKPNKRLEIRTLGRVYMGFYVRQGHPLLSSRKVTASTLRGYPVLGAVPGEDTYPLIRHWLRLADEDPLPETMTCDDHGTLTRLTINSDAVFLSPYSAVSTECTAGRLVELKLTGLRHKGYAPLFLVSLAKLSHSPSAKTIISHIETLLARYMVHQDSV